MIGFIVNPVSGSGRGAKIWKVIDEELRNRDIPFRVRFTAGPGDAVRMAKEMATDAKITAVVAVSGDGTVNEVIQGLWETSLTNPTVFGHIPAGSGNDFARGHGIPADTGKLELFAAACRGPRWRRGYRPAGIEKPHRRQFHRLRV
ncbi:diacylglycerol/lipid kinase family protein [Gorillibacterium massiliense]|uniref:diacylglycerol/lipid kinase family protein n=1 Tax=Gorillibacterium massiliense TaxID=1280390 RepID=UPI00069321BB|nr:acylglycerol kinase family protein [Gorillibacterium massiliense]